MLFTPEMQSTLSSEFSILKKCQTKFDCLLYETFFIN